MKELRWSRYPTNLTDWVTSEHISNGVEFVWLGQAGFIFKSNGMSVGIDPYLSDSLGEKYREAFFPHRRMMDPPCDPIVLRNLNCLLSTHGHTDHMDRGTLGILYGTDGHAPLFVCPRAELAKAVDRGVPYGRMVALDAEESWSSIGRERKAVHIIAIASAHEELRVDSHGNHLFLGYVIEMDGIRLYHSGDCVPYEGLVEQLAKLDIDIAFLPVNGRDTFRAAHGVPGNFTLEEALELVEEASIPYLVPHHFGLFEFNTIDPVEIRRRIPDNGPTVVIPELFTGYSIIPGGDV